MAVLKESGLYGGVVIALPILGAVKGPLRARRAAARRPADSWGKAPRDAIPDAEMLGGIAG